MTEMEWMNKVRQHWRMYPNEDPFRPKLIKIKMEKERKKRKYVYIYQSRNWLESKEYKLLLEEHIKRIKEHEQKI